MPAAAASARGQAAAEPKPALPLFPWRVYARQGVALGLIAFFVIYLWYLSLDRTRVAPNTSIYQSACVFVYGATAPRGDRARRCHTQRH